METSSQRTGERRSLIETPRLWWPARAAGGVRTAIRAKAIGGRARVFIVSSSRSGDAPGTPRLRRSSLFDELGAARPGERHGRALGFDQGLLPPVAAAASDLGVEAGR